MNKRSYKIIFVLLLSSVLAVLLMQVYFLKQFYQQRSNQIRTGVYSALDEVAEQLKKKERFGFVHESIQISTDRAARFDIPTTIGPLQTGRKLTESQRNFIISKKKVEVSDSSEDIFISSVVNGSLEKLGSEKTSEPKVFTIKKGKEKEGFLAENLDSANKVLEVRRLEFSAAEKSTAKQKEVLKLINMVASEIHSIDTLTISQDSVRKMLDASLANNGVDLRYEFAIEKRFENTHSILLQSKYFNRAEVDFEYDLSISNVLKNYRYLLLQVPNINAVVLKSMKPLLLLSAVLSLFILFAFYYALRLIVKQKQLTELRNDFVNNMTHELKTPIATAAIALSALEKEQVKSDREKTDLYHRILREENEKMNQHVERVLQLSMFEKSKLSIEAEVFDLQICIDKAISNFRLKAEAQQSPLLRAPGDKALPVKADAAKIELAINNILDNALKYGGPKNTIRIETIAHEQFACIYVSDQGIGISKDKQAFIFDRFYRVQGGDIHDVKGFGLGLSFVKQIVEMHQGTVACESELGKGSTFIIRLPLYA